MRIYVENIQPKKITRDKLLLLDEYYACQKDILEIFSEKGMYLVENAKVWKLFPTNERMAKIIINGICFLVDECKIEKKICSQLPMDHECVETTSFIYHSRNVRLVIEGYYKETISTKMNADRSDKYCNYIVTNFYFEPKNDNLEITNPYMKNEINVFLSLLN
jgi:hypothetical protein